MSTVNNSLVYIFVFLIIIQEFSSLGQNGLNWLSSWVTQTLPTPFIPATEKEGNSADKYHLPEQLLAELANTIN